MAAIAQEYVPPNRGIPGRREGGGTRGCWSSATSIPLDLPLTALVPQQNIGYTLVGYPTFYLYVPQFYAEQATAAEFVLSDVDGNEVYKTTFQTNDTAGIISLSLPESANLPPLEVGKDYHWSFSLVCDVSDRSADVVVDSWIQRIEPDAQLSAALQTTPPAQLPNLYARSGIWYDALTSVVQLRQQPEQDVPAAQWETLLNSVELDDVARYTLIESVNLGQGGGSR
jgi:hypothetical protein